MIYELTNENLIIPIGRGRESVISPDSNKNDDKTTSEIEKTTILLNVTKVLVIIHVSVLEIQNCFHRFIVCDGLPMKQQIVL